MLKRDLIILKNLLLPRFAKGNHAEQMEAFYSEQVEGYDEFRKRLLHGRPELFKSIDWSKVKTWVDMGAGTGYNLELAPCEQLSRIDLVDLSPSLLKVAEERVKKMSLPQAHCVLHDATTYKPSFTPDLVTFNYSLSMIPDWKLAIDHALKLLPAGGLIASTDFYAETEEEAYRHSWLIRHFWPLWFSYDSVYLKRGTLSYLKNKVEPLLVNERMGSIPYLPSFAKAPYYVFVGRKK